MIVLAPEGGAGPDALLELPPDEVHHLRVRRAEPGEHLELRDGLGLVGEAILLESTAKHALVRVVAARIDPPPPPLALLVAAGDRDRFGWLVEKAAELGVTRIVPVETARSSSVATRVGAAHVARLRRRALEATKQSGAAGAPVLDLPIPLPAAAELAAGAVRWLTDPAGEWPATGEPMPAAVMVGPEGGFTEQERDLVRGAGWTPRRLGDNVLRFETAALAAAAWIGMVRGGQVHEHTDG